MQTSSSDNISTLIIAVIVTIILVIFFIALIIVFQKRIRKKQEELYEAVIKTQEAERIRIGRDLHDDTSPLLSAFKHYIQNEGKGDEWLNNLVKKTIQSIRSAAHNLSPPGLIEHGIDYAVQHMAVHVFANRGAEIIVESHNRQSYLSQLSSLHIYRVISELLANALKHSECTQINVKLEEEGRHLKVVVKDNGKGMDISQASYPEGLGWESINNRLDLVGGTYHIDSNQNGTTINISIPLSKICV